jgi:hypothetical protein
MVIHEQYSARSNPGFGALCPVIIRPQGVCAGVFSQP